MAKKTVISKKSAAKKSPAKAAKKPATPSSKTLSKAKPAPVKSAPAQPAQTKSTTAKSAALKPASKTVAKPVATSAAAPAVANAIATPAPVAVKPSSAALEASPVPHTANQIEQPVSHQASGDISFEPVLCIVGDDGPSLWGLSPRQRAIKQFSRSGVKTVLSEAEASQHNGPVILMRADAVVDTPLIPTLTKRPNFLLLSDDPENPEPIAATIRGSDVAQAKKILQGEAPASSLKLLARAPGQLDNNFWKSLRKREIPYALHLSEQNRDQVEWRMFMGTYKGATDFVTKNLWPVPAFYVTRFLAPRGITPNMVTTIGLILTILTYFLFLKGYFGWGLVCAWAMTFLDTVDGKLARTTLTSSPWGNIFDHGIDLIHPPFWYVAWALGLAHVGYVWSDQLFWTVILSILIGYVFQRILEGIALRLLGSNIHIWRPIDTFFRQITARRNPNLVILTVFTIFMRPDWGLIAVAIWTVVCLLLHIIQIIQAYFEWRKEGELVSWMTKPASKP